MLIYSPISSGRLQYVCKFIFGNKAYSLTTHRDSFVADDGPKINYSEEVFDEHVLTIMPDGLLSEKGIQKQELNISGSGESTILFTTINADFPFDIFSAVFYLLSRYEEYLPHDLDEYGRFPHSASLAYQHNFLNIPLVNIWIADLEKILWQRFNLTENKLQLQSASFKFQPTYDIDIAWAYKEKGILRNLYGFIKSPSLSRPAALLGAAHDPFDSYDFLHDLHKKSGLQPIYFFPLAKEVGRYDKNISPKNPAYRELIKSHCEKYCTGMHPSWQSNEDHALLSKEKEELESITGKAVKDSRQHYIKFNLPQTYQRLIAAGITDDHSMGYGSINGFRASVASSFYWYDLKEEKATPLLIHPFCFMDANCFYEQKLSVSESEEELNYYREQCLKVNGTMVSIFHNNFLGTAKEFKGWREMYERFISQLP